MFRRFFISEERSTFYEEGIAFALLANRGHGAVAGHDNGFVGQGENGVVQRLQDLLHGTTGKVGTANGSGKEGVAGNQFLFSRKIQADAAFGVAGSVKNVGAVRSGSDGLSGVKAVVNFDFPGRGHADPGGLHIEHLEQGVIVLIEKNRGTRRGAKLHGPAHVVDVRVGDDDLADLQIVLLNEGENVVDVVSGIDDHRLARALIADDGTVALQRADGKYFVDHLFIVTALGGTIAMVKWR